MKLTKKKFGNDYYNNDIDGRYAWGKSPKLQKGLKRALRKARRAEGKEIISDEIKKQ